MYRFLFVTLCVLLASSIYSGVWSSAEVYNLYRNTKAVAEWADSEGNTPISVAKYKEAYNIAIKDGAKEIAAWQLNNAAYSLIKKFKKLKKPGCELLFEAKKLCEQAFSLNQEAVYGKLNNNMDYIDYQLIRNKCENK